MVARSEGKGWCRMTHPAGDSRAYHTGRREWRLPASRCQATYCGVDNRAAVRGVQKCVVKWACVEEGGVMKRREFIRHAAGGMAAAALLGSAGLAAKRGLLASLGVTRERLAALPALPRKFAANETVTIGKTGI